MACSYIKEETIMKKWFLVPIILCVLVLCGSAHVFAADGLPFPAAEISVETGKPVDISEYHAMVFDECYYPECLEIVEISDEPGDFCIVTGARYPAIDGSPRFTYQFTAYDWDWFVGDLAAVILLDNHTPEVMDDTVVAARYIGWVN